MRSFPAISRAVRFCVRISRSMTCQIRFIEAGKVKGNPRDGKCRWALT
jgi:hypothetical protein